MKKIIYVVILVVAVVIAFFAGMAVGKGGNRSVVGVYETDSWNGKTGTLVLYKDGSCQYPSGGMATWELDGDTILIKLETSYTKKDGGTRGFNIWINRELSEEKTNEILNAIQELNNVESISWDEETHFCLITLREIENEKQTSKELAEFEGVSIVDILLEQGAKTSEYEAKIMESGIMLQEKFFEKVSN